MAAIIRGDKEIVFGHDIDMLLDNCIIVGEIRKTMVNIITGEIIQEFYRVPPLISFDPYYFEKEKIKRIFNNIISKK